MATVRHVSDVEPVSMPWGSLTWILNAWVDPQCESTFGLALIRPGCANEVHLHPNCEEVIYILEGNGEHLIGDERYRLAPGAVLRIPRGVRHQAMNSGRSPLRMALFYSSPNRETVGE